jgi:hypothetical protein
MKYKLSTWWQRTRRAEVRASLWILGFTGVIGATLISRNITAGVASTCVSPPEGGSDGSGFVSARASRAILQPYCNQPLRRQFRTRQSIAQTVL